MPNLEAPCLIAVLFAIPLAVASAQQSPYIDLQNREIKALSPEAIEQYRSGEGMGLALAAELNGYPGPKHVLELADQLELTADQLDGVRGVFDSMHEQAVDLGHRIIELEAAIDDLFASQEARPERLGDALDTLGAVQAQLRYVHLAAHLEMKRLLTPQQVSTYVRLRGYSDGHHHQPGHHSGPH